MAAIRIRDLSVTYDCTTALDGLSLDIPAGRRLAVVGESGSGKSTLGRCLVGWKSPGATVAGTCEIDGIDVITAESKTLQQLRGTTIAMVMQDSLAALNPLQTIGDAMDESLRVGTTLDAADRATRAASTLQQVQLDDVAGTLQAFPHQLSGGQRQRAAIALAVCRHPKILVADEPTSALDFELAAEICALLKSMSTQLQMTLVMVTHDMMAARSTCEYVAVLNNGKLAAHGTPEEIVANPGSHAIGALIQASLIRENTTKPGP